MWSFVFGSKKQRKPQGKKPVALRKREPLKGERYPEVEVLKAQPIPKRPDPKALVDRMGGAEHLAKVIKTLLDEDRRREG